jgi:hypothetical protein
MGTILMHLNATNLLTVDVATGVLTAIDHQTALARQPCFVGEDTAEESRSDD